MHLHAVIHFFFFFNDTATTEIYTLSLHDALPIYFHFNRILTRGQRFAVRCGERDSRDADAVDVQHHQQGVAGAWAREPQEQTHLSGPADGDPDREGVSNRRHHGIAWSSDGDRRRLAPHADIVGIEVGGGEMGGYREEGAAR